MELDIDITERWPDPTVKRKDASRGLRRAGFLSCYKKGSGSRSEECMPQR